MTYQEMEKEKNSFKDTVAGISIMILLLAFVFMWGVVGGIETDSISFKSGIIYSVILLMIMTLSVAGILYAEKDRDNRT